MQVKFIISGGLAWRAKVQSHPGPWFNNYYNCVDK